MQVVEDTSYRALVAEHLDIPALRVSPRSIMGAVIKALAGRLFVRRGVRYCVDDESNALCKVCLLDPAGDREAALAAVKAAAGKDLETCEFTTFPVDLTFRNYTMTELLRKVLPAGVTPLSGFEQIGHIAHVNLDTEHLPHRFTIGQVILDCNCDTVRTVVNKLGMIDSVFREFKMEVIAGDPTAMTAEVKQYGCVFEVPYDKVYWNSRLSFEHHRLVEQMRPGDELFDVMAGCGPFAVPAAKKGVIVHANDLNPESVRAMRHNADRNGVSSVLNTYIMDGREFIESVVREKFFEISASPLYKGEPRRRHLSMNLPALAVQFLDVFTRPTWRTGKVLDRTALIHVYTFSAAADPLADAVREVEGVIRCAIPPEDIENVTLVRDVAPKKQMVCVSFRLPNDVFKSTSEEPKTKCTRTE